MPPFASAMAWKAAWCCRTPSTVTHSINFATVLLTRLSQDGLADARGTTANTAKSPKTIAKPK